MPPRAMLGLGGALVLALVAARWLASDYTLSLLISVLMYVALTSAWSQFSGYTGYLSFGTVAFFGIGAYTTAALSGTLPFPLVILIAGALTGVFALAPGWVVLRLRGPYFAVFTFGMAELTLHAILWWEIRVSGTLGRIVFPVPTPRVYEALLLLAAFTVLAHGLLARSRVGLALAAIGEDEIKAESLGVNTTAYKVVAFAASAAVMGMVGAAVVPRWTYLDPHIAFNPLISFQVLIMAMIGGARRVEGAVLGAVGLSVLTELLLVRFRYVYLIILGLLLIASVLYTPRGLAGEWDRLRVRLAKVPAGPS